MISEIVMKNSMTHRRTQELMDRGLIHNLVARAITLIKMDHAMIWATQLILRMLTDPLAEVFLDQDQVIKPSRTSTLSKGVEATRFSSTLAQAPFLLRVRQEI